MNLSPMETLPKNDFPTKTFYHHYRFFLQNSVDIGCEIPIIFSSFFKSIPPLIHN